MVRTKIHEQIEKVPNMKLHHTLIMDIWITKSHDTQRVDRPLQGRYFPSLTKNLLLGMCNFGLLLTPLLLDGRATFSFLVTGKPFLRPTAIPVEDILCYCCLFDQ